MMIGAHQFFTHPNGYKMYLEVTPNGFGSGKGTHLSICAHLMQGEFDDLLKWPFRGDVAIELVNQEEDQDHIVKTIHFDESKHANATNRVIKGIYAGTAPGHSKFLSHSDLQPKFLKDNCIKIYVKRVRLH